MQTQYIWKRIWLGGFKSDRILNVFTFLKLYIHININIILSWIRIINIKYFNIILLFNESMIDANSHILN